MSEKVLNRWVVVAGAILIQLALGAIYAWSAFTAGLQSTDAFAFTATQTQAIFSAGLASFGFVTVVGGRLMQRYPARNIAIAGGILLGGGYILGSMGDSFGWKLFSIGIVAGAGIGLAYVVPIAVGVKWFPDRKGLVTGLAVAGFGFGAFLWILAAKPASMFGFTGLLDTDPFTIANINSVFLIYGIIFLVLVLLGSLVMVDPPEGWLPKGWSPPVSESGKAIIKKEFIWKEMMKTPQFYMLWSMFMVGALAGLMVIGNIKNFAMDARDGFMSHGFSETQANDFTILGAALFLPILNGLGRIVWGIISDKIGRKSSFIAMFSAQAFAMFVFFWTTGNQYFFYLVVSMIAFNFGGNFALFPAATADFFGSKNVGLNYGIVFTSYAVGGIIGPTFIGGLVKDNGFAYTWAFLPAAVLCIVAALLAFSLTAPDEGQQIEEK